MAIGQGDPISYGKLYLQLDKLESKGFISSHRSGATEERGGRDKRFVSLTEKGKAEVG